MNKGERIAEGRTAEIFRWGEGEVLKLFRSGWGRRSVEREADVTTRVHAAGAPAPAVRGLVEIDGRFGIVYEGIDGPTNLTSYARQLAELHVRLHACRVDGLPPLVERLTERIEGAAATIGPFAERAKETLAHLPEGEALCHGDFHPYNVLLSTAGPIVIDWHDAATGHPHADVARTCLLIGNSPLHRRGHVRRRVARVGVGTFMAAYLRRYLELRPGSRREIDAWTLPVAAARLSENVREEEAILRRLVENAAHHGANP